ncbi:MAG TPA: FtsL-like putative cell division protein [Luteibaculaceae bacterium]|nr:FtsL-like putative cell division protein [Luteibaculaceae bacterium]
MNRYKENKETKAPPKKKQQGILVQIITGSILTRDSILNQMPFLLYLCLLAVFYIGYGYYGEKTIRELDRVDRELKEIKSEYTTTSTKLEVLRQQSKVAEEIYRMGLQESRVPPKKIVVAPAK